MTIDLKAIEDSARAATPGPWGTEGRRGPGYIISHGVCPEGDGPAGYVGVLDPMFYVAGAPSDFAANAAFFALCNPATVLALTARIAALEGALTDAVETARRYARCYPEASDGRNTFTMLADHIEARALQTMGADNAD